MQKPQKIFPLNVFLYAVSEGSKVMCGFYFMHKSNILFPLYMIHN